MFVPGQRCRTSILLQDLERVLNGKKAALEKWSDLISWSADAREQLTHVQFQLESGKLQSDELEHLSKELQPLRSKLAVWSQEAPNIDSISKQFRTAIQGASAAELLTGLQKQLRIVDDHLLSAREVLQQACFHTFCIFKYK